MPELPEVETTRRGLAPLLEGRRIEAVRVHERRLRWALPRGFEAALEGRRIVTIGRRAKYLLVTLDAGTLLVHLGMSGSLRTAEPALARRAHDHVEIDLDSGRCLRWALPRGFEAALAGRRIARIERRAKYLLVVLDEGTLLVHLGMSGSLRTAEPTLARRAHDHVEIDLDSGRCLRFNDPRRFGSMHVVEGDPTAHPLLRALGPEPLSDGFDADYLYERTRGRRVAIKVLLMNAAIVVGVGNIYASEALFHARVPPGRAAGRVTREEAARIVASVRRVLTAAIRAGGTTLRDYINANGNPGYFRQKLYVYERAGEACRTCSTPIRQRVQGQRSTYWCPSCQR